MKKSQIITLIIILAIILIAIFILYKPTPETDEESVKCIGENSVLYIQLGCHACETQEEIFGENLKYINRVDCFFEGEKCQEIEVTPTWEIKGEFYKGVRSIEELKELTSC